MDTEAVARMAATLSDFAERDLPINRGDYHNLRERVFEHVGDDGDLDIIFTTNYEMQDASNIWGGASILGNVSAYLRALLVSGAPRSGRLMAATDLMEQAQRLFDDRDVTVIAPIVVAGAALEEVLRDLIELIDAPVPGKPGLTTYSQGLQSAGALTPDENKEIVSLASVRNDAAHGQVDSLSRDRAGLFLDRVNLVLRQLADRQPIS